MAVRTLLERLEHPDHPSERELVESEDHLIESIQANLQRVINARRGFAPVAPDYGLSDLSDLTGFGSSIPRVEEEIRKLVERYEPRLTNVKVRFLARQEQRFILQFDITGQMSLGSKNRPALFRSIVEPSGEMTVRRG